MESTEWLQYNYFLYIAGALSKITQFVQSSNFKEPRFTSLESDWTSVNKVTPSCTETTNEWSRKCSKEDKILVFTTSSKTTRIFSFNIVSFTAFGNGNSDPLDENNVEGGDHVSRSRKKKKRSRWGAVEEDKIFIPGMPTILPSNLDKSQEEQYLRKLKRIHYVFRFSSSIKWFMYWMLFI